MKFRDVRNYTVTMKTTSTSTYPLCPSSLTEDQLEQYWRTGFIAFEGALSPEEVAAARQSITDMVAHYAFNDEAAVYTPPKGDHGNHAGGQFNARDSRLLIQLEAGFHPDPAKPEELESKVRKFMWFENESDIFRSIYTDHPRIQGVVQSILGEGSELYQAMALIKPALHGSSKPWHQDNAYFAIEDMDAILGTWIALDDVTLENGAMHFLSGAHRDGPLKHEHTTDCEIVKDRYSPENAEAVCLNAGGIVFFHGNAPHFTPPNHTPHRRRALQYHYRGAANREISKEDYNQIFVEKDGAPASCAAAIPENF